VFVLIEYIINRVRVLWLGLGFRVNPWINNPLDCGPTIVLIGCDFSTGVI